MGYSLGCSNLGETYRDGTGTEVDVPRAVSLFERACREESMHGCQQLALGYLNGVGVPKDLKRATDLFRQSCELGLEESCKELETLKVEGK